ncbi:MAG: NnrU family protein [Pacificimonas sp.]|jgi:uncharacterized membrane protein|nr:NnrU family protein [Pacificimonas sp.]
MLTLTAAMAAFVGTHFLMSHPLRAPMVKALGTLGFTIVYSLVSLATLIWAVLAYGDTIGEQLWFAPTWLVAIGHVLMWIASILFVGSNTAPNPALAFQGGQLDRIERPGGAMRITRHPMMWSFAIWAAVHIALAGRSDTLVFAGGILILALVGAALQDGKKRQQLGDKWDQYEAATSYWPRPAFPGWIALIGGTALYALLIWLHPGVMGASTRLGELI